MPTPKLDQSIYIIDVFCIELRMASSGKNLEMNQNLEKWRENRYSRVVEGAETHETHKKRFFPLFINFSVSLKTMHFKMNFILPTVFEKWRNIVFFSGSLPNSGHFFLFFLVFVINKKSFLR